MSDTVTERMIRLLCGFFTAALILGAPVDAATGQADAHRRLVDRHFKAFLDADLTPGLVVGILHEGEREIHAFGYTDFGDEALAIRPSTQFEIGDLTGLFTALLLAELDRTGEVAMRSPLSSAMPQGLPIPTRFGAEPTLEDLASNTGGLWTYPPVFAPGRDDGDPFAHMTRERVERSLAATELRSVPGERFEHSPWGMGLLGDAMSRLTGRPIRELMRERVLGPLGLERTDWPSDAAGPTGRAVAVPHAEGFPAPMWTYDALAGAGGMLSTADDLLSFAALQIDAGGHALSEAMAATRRWRAAITERPGAGTALGWRIAPDGETLWMVGETGGSTAAVYVTPSLGLAVVALANGKEERVALAAERLHAALAGFGSAPVSVSVPPRLTAAERARLVGLYVYPGGAEFAVRELRDRLVMRFPNGAESRAIPTSKTAFRFPTSTGTVAFEMPEGGGAATAVELRFGGQVARFERVMAPAAPVAD